MDIFLKYELTFLILLFLYWQFDQLIIIFNIY